VAEPAGAVGIAEVPQLPVDPVPSDDAQLGNKAEVHHEQGQESREPEGGSGAVATIQRPEHAVDVQDDEVAHGRAYDYWRFPTARYVEGTTGRIESAG
jgi:hypothetical protein